MSTIIIIIIIIIQPYGENKQKVVMNMSPLVLLVLADAVCVAVVWRGAGGRGFVEERKTEGG